MNQENWQKIKEIFHQARELAPDKRTEFLDKVCAGNAEIREQVNILLESYESGFLEEPLIDEPTKLFDGVMDETGMVETELQNSPDTKPTEILTQEPKTNIETEMDEMALHSNRLRFIGMCLIFTLTFVGVVGRFYFIVSFYKSEFPWAPKEENEIVRVDSRHESLKGKLEVDDEILRLNGQPIKTTKDIFKLNRLEPETPYTLEIRRNGEEQKVEFATEPFSAREILERYLWILFVPVCYLLTALFVFLLKPNDKLALLMALMFCLYMSFTSSASSARSELPDFLNWVIFINYISSLSLLSPVFFHFYLIFPRRPDFVRRFPKIEWLLYLPLPVMIFTMTSWGVNNYFEAIQNNEYIGSSIVPYLWYLYPVYFFGGLMMLLFNYFRADKPIKRKIRLVVLGVIAGLSFIWVFLILNLLNLVFGININLVDIIINNPWLSIIQSFLNLLLPLSFAYAILKHKVIPISFVIRRGLQYLLAKNALRLFLILPILGIIWNISTNPNRTLSEILGQNSADFYVFVFLAVGLVLLNRFGLREWIDRKFFREQYNQELILRESVEAVKESDSLVKLSRLVSSQIQAALHPENVYLFFRDDANQSDFSLGYSTDETSEKSSNLKLTADSPLLNFMQLQTDSVDFPSRKTDELQPDEKNWLRSIGANLLVPMHGTDGKLAGFFSLGEKLSEIPYTGRDKELLEMLANQIALVHENLSLKERMRSEQKIKTEVLSRLDEGNINLLKECPKCGKCYDRTEIKCQTDDAKLTFSLPVERTIENRYRLEKLLGKGGMGAVYEATDTRINRPVALKILSGAMFGNREALRRFEREAQTAGRLQHRNIVTIHDYGVLSSEGAFLVMELVKGESLRNIMVLEGTLKPETVVEWFSQILEGLEAAHSAGIVHRDLKPDNIILESRNAESTGAERLCILDFGLARLAEREIELAQSVTIPGMVMGTLGYMSPEQLKGEKTDKRSDLFAVGVMIFEALKGKKPFLGKTYHQLVRAMNEEIDLDFPDSLKKFFAKALAKNREDRFSTASEMKEALIGCNQ